MNESTNIITVRKYEDGSKSVSINGRHIPDVSECVQAQDGKVYIVLQCAQFNVLDGDEHAPAPTFQLIPDPPQRSWRQRIAERWPWRLW